MPVSAAPCSISRSHFCRQGPANSSRGLDELRRRRSVPAAHPHGPFQALYRRISQAVSFTERDSKFLNTNRRKQKLSQAIQSAQFQRAWMGRRKQLAPQSQLSRMASLLLGAEESPLGEDGRSSADTAASASHPGPVAPTKDQTQHSNEAQLAVEPADESNTDEREVEDMDEDDLSSDLSNGPTAGSPVFGRLRCSICRKQFKHKKSLQRHVQLHSGVRKHKCAFCSAAFVRSDHLRSHVRTHLARPKQPELALKSVASCDDEEEAETAHENSTETRNEKEQRCLGNGHDLKIEKDFSNTSSDSAGSTVHQKNGLANNEESPPTSTSASTSLAPTGTSSNTASVNNQDRQDEDQTILATVARNNQQINFSAQPTHSNLFDPFSGEINRYLMTQQQQIHHQMSSHPFAMQPAQFAPSICGFCGGLATKHSEAVYHLIVHCARQECRYTCGVCGCQCRDSDSLRAHAAQLHTGQVYRCSAVGCGVLSETAESAEAHFLRVHAQEHRSLACALCPGELFDCHADLYEHLVGVHFSAASATPCPPPSAPTLPLLPPPTQQSPRQRLGKTPKHTPPPLPPPQLQQPSPLVLSRVAQELSRLCSYCGRQFPDERQVLEHQVREHRLGDAADENTADNEPEDSATGSRQQQQQQQKQSSKQQFYCAYCSHQARSSTELERHVKSTHRARIGFGCGSGKSATSADRQQRNWCNICDEKFSNPRQLEQHKQTHHRHEHYHDNKLQLVVQLASGANTKDATQQRINAQNKQERTQSKSLSLPVAHPCTSCGQPVTKTTTTATSTSASVKSEMCNACDVAKATLCPFCIQTFAGPAQLRTHLVEQHAVSAPPPSLTANIDATPISMQAISSSSSTSAAHDSLALAYARLNSLAFEATKTAMAHAATAGASAFSTVTTAAATPAAIPALECSTSTPHPKPPSSTTAASATSSRDLTGFYFSKVNGKFICQVCDKGFTKEDDLTSHRLVHLTALVSRSGEPNPTSETSSISSQITPESSAQKSSVKAAITRDKDPRRKSGRILKPRTQPNYSRRCTHCNRKFSSWKSRLLHQNFRHWRKNKSLTLTDY